MVVRADSGSVAGRSALSRKATVIVTTRPAISTPRAHGASEPIMASTPPSNGMATRS